MNISKNIVLVGFMGAGKSLIGRLLAQKLCRTLLSTDDLIVAAEGKPIIDIFSQSGEAYFREVEKRIVAEVSGRQGVIIDCGGGVVIAPENLRNLQAAGVVFYLHATPEAIYERIKSQKHRPLLNVADPQAKIAEILSTRLAYYAQADHQIETTARTPESVCQDIVALMQG